MIPVLQPRLLVPASKDEIRIKQMLAASSLVSLGYDWSKRDPDEVLRICVERHQTVV
jgi:hypothetical protein